MGETALNGIEVWRSEFPLRFSFSHNLAARDHVETLFVALRTVSGAVGFGQALPRSYLTGESLDSVLVDIRDRWWPDLSAMRFPERDLTAVLSTLRPLYLAADAARRNASYAALEIAVLDAWGRQAGLPIAPGPAEGGIPLVGVISAGNPGRTAWIARLMKWLGYRNYKIKVGMDARTDRLRLAAVRKIVGSEAWLAVDANAAWRLDEAAARMRGLKEFGVALVEEPLCPQDAAVADFSRLEKDTGLATMADESLCTLDDARQLLSRGGPSWWNLRLAKNGGMVGAGTLSDLARQNGVGVYGGILVGETSLLCAAAKAILPGTGATRIEYGFPRVFLRGDPFRGGPGGFSGNWENVCNGSPGFGVSLSMSALRRSGSLVWSAGERVGFVSSPL